MKKNKKKLVIKSTRSQNYPFIDREISWLYFNERVLQEAENEATPLIERVRFLGIFSNNQDEFYRVRVATIKRLTSLDKKELDFNPEELLKEINKIVLEQQRKFLSIFRKIVNELKKNDIIILDETTVTAQKHIMFLRDFYDNQLRSQIFPIILSTLREGSILRDENVYLVISLSSSENPSLKEAALIEVPTKDLPRVIILPDIGDDKTYIMLLDDVIRFFLKDIFSMLDFDTFKAYTIKITRDAELDIDNDVSKSFIDRIEESLKQRYTNDPVRFVYDKRIPEKLLKLVMKKLEITEEDSSIAGGKYHNFKDFMHFPKIGPNTLHYSELTPLPHNDFINAKRLLDVLDEKDVMLTFPYQSFQYIIDILREASINPEVKSIYMTVYRVAKNSKVMNALINAARNNKKVTVFMELQARFDEETNIYWSERLKEEGVQIIHSIPGLKVHSKLILICRVVNNKEKYYSLIGTGNFNEATAKVYSDNILLTSNQVIGEDVRNVFNLFEKVYRPFNFRTLIISPFSTRKFIISKLNKLIEAAKNKQKAECIIKLNSLVDKEIAKKLYIASKAGVKIKLIVRGMCILIPQIKGLSENIFAISIVDRFLEHSRILYFNINGNEEFYISSADWMPRNLDNRIEVTCPIFDKSIQKQLKYYLELQLADNTKARYHDDKGSITYVTNNKKKVRAQYDFYTYCLTQLSK